MSSIIFFLFFGLAQFGNIAVSALKQTNWIPSLNLFTFCDDFFRLALEQSGTFNSVLPWARSGFTGAQYFHSMMWAGDQNVDWSQSDGLPSSIVAGI
jgi:hypothetical protein